MPEKDTDIDYGAPDEGDSTAGFEKLAIDTAIEANRFIAQEGEKVLNRPMGSRPTTRREQQAEFEANYADPDFMVEMYRGFLGKHGGNKIVALTDMGANYVMPNLRAMEKRRQRTW